MKVSRLFSGRAPYALLVVGAVICGAEHAVPGAQVFTDVSTARLSVSFKANPALEFADGTRWPVSGRPAMALEAHGVTQPAESAELSGDTLAVRFIDGSRAEFQVLRGRGFAVFRLVRLEAQQPVTRFRLFQLAAPLQARICGTVNGAAAQTGYST